MYNFLSLLSASDLGLHISALVTGLGILWLHAREISFNACLSQMFFIHFFMVMESSALWATAFDHFVVISNPLRYASILTDLKIAQIRTAIVTRGTLILTSVVVLLKILSFCLNHVLHHSYCFHPGVVKLSCTDTRLNSALGLPVIISVAGIGSIFIPLSCILIIHSVLNIASPGERKKAFSTCVSHLCTLPIFCIPLISLSFAHRFGKFAPPFMPTPVANVYLLIAPVMNPIIYSVKTKQIQKAVLKHLFPKKT